MSKSLALGFRNPVRIRCAGLMDLLEDVLSNNLLGFFLLSRMSGSRGVVDPPVEASLVPPGGGMLGGIFHSAKV